MTPDRPSALQALLAGLVEAVVFLDRDGRVTGLNAAAVRLTGWTAEAAVGQALDVVVPVTEEWSSTSALARASPEVDGRLRSRGGEQRLVRVRRRPHTDGEVVVIEDRTQERKRAHRLAYADRLANGGALASLVLRDVPTLLVGDAAPAIAEARRRTSDALRLLSEPAATDHPDVAEVVRWAIDTVPRPPSVVVELEVAPGLRTVLASVLLRQVVANVVANAVRATGERGRVRVAAGRVNGSVELVVSDDGPGLAHDPELAFQPYYTTLPGAQGLGLSVARDIVVEAGGTIAFAGTAPTRLRIVLPAAAQPAPQGHRILVVDSEPPVVRLLARVLRDVGVEVVGANGAETALRHVRDAGPLDAALCALDLPDRDGAELCRELVRARPALAGRICLLAGSEQAVASQRRTLSDVVGPESLVKPFDPQQVRAVVTALLER